MCHTVYLSFYLPSSTGRSNSVWKKILAVGWKLPSLKSSSSSTDMHIFGHCPAHDEICLVVCSHCEQVVKPQAFEKHCERRHSALTKMCGQSSSVAPQQRPRPGRPAPNLSSPRERQKDGRCFEASGPSAAPMGGVHQHRPPKAQREAVRYCSVLQVRLTAVCLEDVELCLNQ